MAEQVGVAVVGGGQAGLATSHELMRADVEHVVLERGRVGETWRRRWDSFCLVTPNWALQLPAGSYEGDDPDGFMARDEVVAHLEGYAADAPVRIGVEVTTVTPLDGGGFILETSDGPLRARSVVVATGAYQRPYRPPAAAGLPADVHRLDADDYRNEAGLPAGRVLVVGCGQSGCQIAEELADAGRDVYLACGRAPWLNRRIGDRDVFWWLIETGFLDAAVESLPSPEARLFANVQGTGTRGGRDLNYRTLRDAGVTLLGHFTGVDGGKLHFADDLAASVAWGDERYRQIRELVWRVADERGLAKPELPDPAPFDGHAPEQIDLAGLTVVFAGGFRPDYRRWVHVPGAFDDAGFPEHRDGASTAAPGLYFVGVHFLRKRKSALLYGVGEDAALVAGAVAGGAESA